MKALQKSPISPDRAFECNFLKASHFDHNWHFHSEYQLFTVLKGTGTRFIGDHVHPFKPGDVVLTGPNLPHLWRSDPEYFDGDPQLWTEGIVVYFPEAFFANHFFAKNGDTADPSIAVKVSERNRLSWEGCRKSFGYDVGVAG